MMSNHDELYAALAACIGSLLSAQCNANGDRRETKVGILVERAGATIERMIRDFADSDRWLYFRVATDSSEGSRLVAHQIAPMLRRLKNNHSINGWWWLNKIDSRGAAVRLRVFVPSASREVELAIRAQLAEFGRDFRVLCYEPELRLFGGIDGMRAAHEYFCADSEFLAAWGQEGEPQQKPIIPEGLSVALILRILRSAGLDLFECWDVFDRVCDKRRIGHTSDARFARYQELARKVVQARPDRIFRLYRGEKARLLSEYGAFLDAFGRKINLIYFDGRLECGLREFLVPIILFHWNRVRLTPFGHFGLSHSVAQELARLSHKGTMEASNGAVVK